MVVAVGCTVINGGRVLDVSVNVVNAEVGVTGSGGGSGSDNGGLRLDALLRAIAGRRSGGKLLELSLRLGLEFAFTAAAPASVFIGGVGRSRPPRLAAVHA